LLVLGCAALAEFAAIEDSSYTYRTRDYPRRWSSSALVGMVSRTCFSSGEIGENPMYSALSVNVRGGSTSLISPQSGQRSVFRTIVYASDMPHDSQPTSKR
jgi:hypothetical protein